MGTTERAPFWNRVLIRTVWRGPAAALQLIDKADKDQWGLDEIRALALTQLGRPAEARSAMNQLELPFDSEDLTSVLASPRARVLLSPGVVDRDEQRRPRALPDPVD